MKINLMRAIDRFIGVPLCWITGMWPPHSTKTRVSDGDPVLVIKFFGLGSLVLAMPFLHALRSNLPNSPLYLLTFAQNREVAERLPFSHRSLFIDTTSPLTFIVTTISVLKIVRSANVQVVFDLEFFSKFSTLINRLSGAQICTGFELPTVWRRRNLTHAVAIDKTKHVMEVFLSQLFSVGIPARNDGDTPSLQSSPTEVVALGEKLRHLDVTEKLVVINVNAGPASVERRWPAEYFAQAILELHRVDVRRQFLLVGSIDERPYVQQVIDSADELRDMALNVAGALSLGEYIALCEISEFVLSNDSGPLHLAAAAGARVIGLFGPESPRFYGPVGKATVIYGETHCSPCLSMYNAKYFVCPYNAACMKEISVADVLRAAQSIKTSYARAS